MRIPLLSLIVFLPIIGAVLLGVAGPRADRWARAIALGVLGACLAGSVYVAWAYSAFGTTFAERGSWVPSAGIYYILGVDGLSVFLLLLSAAMVLISVGLSAADLMRPRLYYGLWLVLATGLLGVFCALDLVLFYVFWEVVFVPIYFLIAIWGEEGAQRAAMKFLIWMLVGSLVMLLGIVAVYFAATPHTFDLVKLAQADFAVGFQRLAFAAFFVGFAIKIPIFPFHVWLPDAYTLAPAPLTAVMAACLAAMGIYGYWRVAMSVVPAGARAFGGLVAILAAVSVVYGDLCATVQRDLKRMTAYSSISHMGFVTFGAAAANVLGVRGSVLHTFNHGVAMAALFLVIEQLRVLGGSRDPRELSALMSRAPLLAAALWVASLGSYAMPGLATFPGELTILLGAFSEYPVLALLALAASIIMAGYIFWVLARVTLGTPAEGIADGLPADLGGTPLAVSGMLGISLLVLGVAPVLITGPAAQSVGRLVARMAGS